MESRKPLGTCRADFLCGCSKGGMGFLLFMRLTSKTSQRFYYFFAAPSFLIPYAGEAFKHNPRAARLPPNLLNFFMDKRG